MKVRELIEKLKIVDPDLPVCLADWNEEHREPDEAAAEQVRERDGLYYAAKSTPEGATCGRHVVIG